MMAEGDLLVQAGGAGQRRCRLCPSIAVLLPAENSSSMTPRSLCRSCQLCQAQRRPLPLAVLRR